MLDRENRITTVHVTYPLFETQKKEEMTGTPGRRIRTAR